MSRSARSSGGEFRTRLPALAGGAVIVLGALFSSRSFALDPAADSPYFVAAPLQSRVATVDAGLAATPLAWSRVQSREDAAVPAASGGSLLPVLISLSLALVDDEQAPDEVDEDATALPDEAPDVAVLVAKSSYDFNKSKADISTCSAKDTNQGTCSTQGLGPQPGDPEKPGGVGACSATGKDDGHGMPGTDLAECSTSKGTEGKSGTTVCSIQPVPDTWGGGCSAGALPKDDPRDNPKCSALAGSPDGSLCSVKGGNGDSTEVDCTAGWNQEGEKSSCSAFAGAGDKSFCSASDESKDKPNKASCSAWNNANPQPAPGGEGKGGDATCSVILSGAADGGGTLKCSVKGSHGGDPSPPQPPGGDPNGQDGFCTVGTGGGQEPGNGKSECSVIGTPAPGGPTAQCSVFDADGNFVSPPAENDNSKNKCFLPKEKPPATPTPAPPSTPVD
jgi:hypothetical protein